MNDTLGDPPEPPTTPPSSSPNQPTASSPATSGPAVKSAPAPSSTGGSLISYPTPASMGVRDELLSTTDRNEKLLSALSHASALTSFSVVTLAIPFLVYYFNRHRSAYVEFQSIQGLAMHILFAVVMWAGGALIVGLAASIVGILLIPGAMLVFGAIALVLIGYVFLAVLKTLSGEPFEYRWLGPWVHAWLAKAR